MKKATLYILLYIICGLLVLSCGHSGGNSSRTVVFRLEMPDGESFHWDEGYRDCFHIFENGAAPEDMIVDFTDGDVMLTLVYPASSATSFKYTGFINGRSSKNPAIGTEQKYDGELYDLSSDIMTVDPLVMYPGENESYLDLERVVAVSNVYVSGLGSGEHITSVTITSTNDISATYLLSSGSFNNGVKTMVARGESATTPDGEAFSFVSIPTSSSRLSFTMTTTSRTLTLDRSVVLKAGMNAIFLDVEDGGPIGPVTDAAGWLELPAITSSPESFVGTFYGTSTDATAGPGKSRNYTYLYDKEYYTCLWVAYPLYDDTTGGTRYKGPWEYNPVLDSKYQVNVYSSYNVLYGETDYVQDAAGTGEEFYARGHQIPDADRSGHGVMQSQTYFYTNSTPQIQNTFNSTVWMDLEDAVRGAIPSNDTLYVVTGAAFRIKGGNEKITYIHPKKDPLKDVPVPNYYWKILLKVKRSGSTVTSASTIGFWLPHQKMSGKNYTNYSCSVDSIEEKTGFDFFANLPESVSSKAESNTSFSTFKSFR